MSEKKKIQAIILLACFISLILSGCISSTDDSPSEKSYCLIGFLVYNQHIDENKTITTFETYNISLGINEYHFDEWTIEKNSKEIKCYDNSSLISFQYYIFVDLNKYPLPEGNIYTSNNSNLTLLVGINLWNKYYFDGYQAPSTDNAISIFLDISGTNKDDVNKWKPIMRNQLDYVKQIIYEATGLTPIKDDIEFVSN